jgi:hypothetical protein
VSRAARVATFLALSIAIPGCGYRLANTQGAALGPFTVRAAEAKTPDAVAITAAIEGAQRELARGGLLSARGEGTTLTISIVRVDERSEGIAAGSGPSAAPIARGIRLTIVGRATAPATARAAARDTGDVIVAEVFAASGGAAIGILARDEAAQRAGQRLGERLVRRVLGDVDPGEP